MLIERYIKWILSHRFIVITAVLLLTVAFTLQIANIRIIIDPNTLLPQSHPYVIATDTIEKVFGSKYVVVIAVTPKAGDVFQPDVLAKVQRMTAALIISKGVVRENILSLSARRAKSIIGTGDGLEANPLMSNVPQTALELAALREHLQSNTAYLNTIVSADMRTAAIFVEFREGPAGFRGIMERVNAVVEPERTPFVDIAIGGPPVFLSHIEMYAERMVFLFPLATLIVGLIHYEAFRTIQGLVLPLVTALLAVVWGMGIMGIARIPMDTFNSTTPILILAIAAGHSVQLLKRYYEEYQRARENRALSPRDASLLAVVRASKLIGPVMIIAGSVASLGFFSLTFIDIISVRTFGILTGVGIVSALILEMTFVPALRSLLPPPGETECRLERQHRFWDRVTDSIALCLSQRNRAKTYIIISLLLILALAGMCQVVVDNSTRSFFAQHLAFQHDDRVLNSRLAGTNTLYVLLEGSTKDAIKEPKVLRAMESTQQFIEREPNVGKTLSLVDFVKQMNQAMHGNEPTYFSIPPSRDLIAQYLFLYSIAGDPGDFDSYVDYDYQVANIAIFLKTDSSAQVEELISKIEYYAKNAFDGDIHVKIGGTAARSAALNEVIVQSKIWNIVQICLVVFLISSMLFRSFFAGAIVLAPLLLAVISNFGLMGYTGMRLNIPNALSSAMSVGIGADYAIYLIYRLKEEIASGISETEAIHSVLETAGQACLYVASAVAGGYAVLVFSFGFHLHVWLAILIANAMLVSVMSALILIPALALSIRPAFIFGDVSTKAASK